MQRIDPLLTSPLANQEPNQIMYSEQDIEGKGIGCIANQKIKKGTLILREAPVLHFFGDVYWTSQNLVVLMKAYIEMDDKDKEEYMKLSNSFSEEKEGLTTKRGMEDYIKKLLDELNSTGDLTEDVDDFLKTALSVWQIFESNAFHNGVFLKMSRFNHGCSPNAEYFWNEDIEKRDLRARRIIKEGEEITHSYLDKETLTWMERQKKLREDFNFECKCEFCSKTEDEIQNETIKCEHFRKIAKEKEELEIIASNNQYSLVTVTPNPMATISDIKAELKCVQQMYKIARELKLMKNQYILSHIVEEGFNLACHGVLLGMDTNRRQLNLNPIPEADLDEFMKSANNFANVGEHIAVVTFREHHTTSQEWKQRKKNPIDFFL